MEFFKTLKHPLKFTCIKVGDLYVIQEEFHKKNQEDLTYFSNLYEASTQDVKYVYLFNLDDKKWYYSEYVFEDLSQLKCLG